MMRIRMSLVAAIVVTAFMPALAELWPSGRDAVQPQARPFELRDVRLLDGPFRDAMERTRRYQRTTSQVTAGRLDVSATRSVDGRRLSVAALNRHAHQPVEVVLRMKGQECLSKVTIHTLTSPDIRSVNTWERPNEVRAVSRTVADSSSPITLPSHSVNIIEFIC